MKPFLHPGSVFVFVTSSANSVGVGVAKEVKRKRNTFPL